MTDIETKQPGVVAQGTPTADQIERRFAVERLHKQALKLSCEDQHQLAILIAANVGYVLAPEPPHPDCPHHPQPAGAEREALAAIGVDEINLTVMGDAAIRGWAYAAARIARDAMESEGDLSHTPVRSGGLEEALQQAADSFENIRKILINNLNDPERRAFWQAVKGRDSARAALNSGGDHE
jgi:hypothetical protein